MIGIYKITSPSGRIYIGQTTNSKDRFRRYYYLDCKEQTKLYRSFLKYEVKNHIFEFIEECDITQLNERERYYQDLYDVLNVGLNCVLTQTNDKSGKASLQTRLKISNSNKIRRKGIKQKLSSQSKKVICTKTGKIWDCIAYCAKELKCSRSTLARYLNNTRKNTTTIKYYTTS
jgi:group I intron endonuclease